MSLVAIFTWQMRILSQYKTEDISYAYGSIYLGTKNSHPLKKVMYSLQKKEFKCTAI